MASLQNQTISTSYGQLLKTVNAGGIDGTLQAIEDGDGTTSALELSNSGVRSTGTLNAAGATTLSSTLSVTGAATLSSSLSVASTSTFTGAATFGTNLTASTGTATIGTLRIGSGSNLIAQSYGTAAFTAATLGTVTTASAISTGTFALANVALGDIVVGSINYTVSGFQPTHTFRPESAGVARFVVANSTSTLGTLSAGTIFATALRYS